MIVYQDISEIEIAGESAVTVGTFDGVHRGHRIIFERLKELALKDGLKSSIVTFDPHPRKVINTQNKPIQLLTTITEKLAIFEQMGIEQVVIIPFSKKFAAFSPVKFVQEILVNKLATRKMVIGYDHHFGRNRSGRFENLQQLGKKLEFQVFQIPPFELNGEVISSSVIRKLLLAGEIEKVTHLMGRPYQLSGTVVQGEGRGRELGFPTANILPKDEDKLLPDKGVYTIEAVIERQHYEGMMNIGLCPTFNSPSLTFEAHIFNFNADIYGKELEIRFKKFIRKEKKFSDPEALKCQLREDKKKCENV